MLRANRNDPCPCGSGKKYKNCCMRHDQISASRALTVGPAEGPLLNALYGYAQGPRFSVELLQGFHSFWGGNFDPTVAREQDADDMRLTLEWFVHDARVGSDRRHVIDLFIENETRDYPPEAMQILQSWAAATIGLFTVELVAEDALHLIDLVREQPVDVSSPMLSHRVRPQDVLVGRLYRLGEQARLSYMTLILPPVYRQPLADYLRNAFGIYQDEHYGATWEQFLRENGHLPQAFLLSARGEALRSYIGPGTRYHDPAPFRDHLATVTREREQERQREAMEKAQAPAPAMRRTGSGLVLPGAESEPPAGEEAPRSRILIPGRDV